MHRLVFSPAALRKLDSMYGYIADTLETPRAASVIVAGILDHLDTLKNNPDIGPRISSRIGNVHARFAETGFLVCGNYVAIYDHVDTVIQVLAIYHGKEDFFGRIFKEID